MICLHVCPNTSMSTQYLWRREEGIGSSGNGVMDGYDVVLGIEPGSSGRAGRAPLQPLPRSMIEIQHGGLCPRSVNPHNERKPLPNQLKP